MFTLEHSGGFWLCIYAFCGLQGSAPSIESGSVWGFLWVWDGDRALVAAQSKCTYTLWELSAAIQKCQAQYQVDFTHKQVGPRPLCHLFCAVTSFFYFFFYTSLTCTKDERVLRSRYHSSAHTPHRRVHTQGEWVQIPSLCSLSFSSRLLNSSLCCGTQRRLPL